MQTGKNIGMFTLDDSLLGLAESGTVSAEEALSKSQSREELAARINA